MCPAGQRGTAHGLPPPAPPLEACHGPFVAPLTERHHDPGCTPRPLGPHGGRIPDPLCCTCSTCTPATGACDTMTQPLNTCVHPPVIFPQIAATVNITIPFADTDTGGFFWLSPSDRKAGKAVVLAGAFNAAISSGAFGDIGLTKATAYSGTDPRHPDVIGATEIGGHTAACVRGWGGAGQRWQRWRVRTPVYHVGVKTLWSGQPSGCKTQHRSVGSCL